MNTNRQEIIKLAGFTGAAMLIAGYFRHYITEFWGWFNLSLVIVGGVLFLGAVILNFRSIVAFFGGRSAKLGTNTIVLSIAVLAILGILNFLGFRHHKRFDLTTEQLNTLSDQSKKILNGLQNDVKVVKFDKENDPRLSDLMAEFKYNSRHFSFERIDPQQKPDAVNEYINKYKIQRLNMGDTIVASGERMERPQSSDEQGMINAILKVTKYKSKQICFTTGHGEKSLSSSEPTGYAKVEAELKGEIYEAKTITLAASNQVPAECDVLISAGPTQAFLPEEANTIGKFLEDGGKFFLMVDPNTNPELNDLLKAWHITIGNDVIIATARAGSNPVTPVANDYSEHPITRDMQRQHLQTFYPEARSVKSGDSAKGDIVQTEIIKTLEGSWAETDLKAQPLKFDEGKDTKGPVSLGVAASRKVGDKEGRLVVIGDSDFVCNGAIRYNPNRDIFLNTINWLAQDEDLISIRPKSATNRSVTMTDSQQRLFWWLTAIFMPLAVILSGGYVWWKRR